MPRYSAFGGYGDKVLSVDRAIAIEVKTPYSQRPVFVSATANMVFPSGGAARLGGNEFARIIVYTGELGDLANSVLHAGNWEFVQSCGISRLLATTTFMVNGYSPCIMEFPPLPVPLLSSLANETLGAALLLPCDQDLVSIAACYASFSFFGAPVDSADITKYRTV
jgi:hypothetical protein